MDWIFVVILLIHCSRVPRGYLVCHIFTHFLIFQCFWFLFFYLSLWSTPHFFILSFSMSAYPIIVIFKFLSEFSKPKLIFLTAFLSSVSWMANLGCSRLEDPLTFDLSNLDDISPQYKYYRFPSDVPLGNEHFSVIHIDARSMKNKLYDLQKLWQLLLLTGYWFASQKHG